LLHSAANVRCNHADDPRAKPRDIAHRDYHFEPPLNRRQRTRGRGLSCGRDERVFGRFAPCTVASRARITGSHDLYPQSQSCNALSQFAPQSRTRMNAEYESKGTGMTKENERLAREREQIAARVAGFKAIQEKFKREREEFFVTTLQKALDGDNPRRAIERMPFWP